MTGFWPFGRGEGNAKVTNPLPGTLTTEERMRLARKCQAFTKGLAGCRRANLGYDQGEICRNLEMRVVTCYAADVCKVESEEHRRCYTKVYKTGAYNGATNCVLYEDAMQACLSKEGLYPV